MIKRERTVYTIDLGPSEEAKQLAGNLDNYIALTGETKKWFVLQGMARLIGEAEDNPQLVLQIAEYLAGVKRGRPSNENV
jgi:hypothetical protein